MTAAVPGPRFRDQLAEVLSQHEPQWHDGYLTGEPEFFSCGTEDEHGRGCDWVSDPESDDWATQHRRHIADALMPTIAAEVEARVQAAANQRDAVVGRCGNCDAITDTLPCPFCAAAKQGAAEDGVAADREDWIRAGNEEHAVARAAALEAGAGA